MQLTQVNGSVLILFFFSVSVSVGITSNHRASTDTPPANALTLDEIHAREDIHPTSTQPPQDRTSTGEGMEAFNKLLAVLESKQSVRRLCGMYVL